ncbi:MAG TPA: hypothetical protein VGR20_01365 [Acidimicrobiia bacterium]|jgi:hypothetical protein|nr:hypothetical protein [Acidimicrobiia bacterium]
MGNYDEMTTARLTWVVLDQLVPSDDAAGAQAELIARDPELQSLVAQGALSEDEAIGRLRERQGRYGGSTGGGVLRGQLILVVLILLCLVWAGVTALR